MAPKRRTRASSTDNGLAPGQVLKRATLSDNLASPWAWVDTEAKDPSQITLEHRLMSCGLSHRNRHPFCRNQLKPKPEVKETVASTGATDDVIVISDDEEPTCSKKTCKSNPNCLNYVNVDSWADGEKATEQFLEAVGLADDPLLSFREPDLPVGLKNLGATCYANASLQVWYRDETFRRGVYECRPHEGSEEAFKNSPLHQLQITFAALQECTQNVFNPVKLIDSLHLNTTEQQDAQEFSKLFLHHLDLEFKKQSSPSLSALVDNQFQGKKVYGTLCDMCGYQSEHPDEFREIEINFKNNARLEDCITAYLKSEKLDGDNKYYCSRCDSHQDATRYTKFQHFPPVLNFSLLRFVYDFDKMERKKSKNNISFPVQIDMSRFIGDAASRRSAPPQSDGQIIYDLQGVLLHKGDSAHHGHYEAQAYDHSSKAWFQFNDEVVTKIKKLGKPPPEKEIIDLENDEKPRVKKPAKRRRVEDSDDEHEKPPERPSPAKLPVINEVSSRDAYMLIYAKRSLRQGNEPIDTSPSVDVLQNVQELNTRFEDECEEYTKKREIAQNHFAQKRRTVIDIYRSWSTRSINEDCVIVSKNTLDDWLTKHAMQDAATSFEGNKKLSKGNGKGKSPEASLLSVSEIVCPHGLLNPEKASDMKRITSRAFDRITEETKCPFEKKYSPQDVCSECVQAAFKERLYDIRHPQDVNRFDALADDKAPSTGYWISKSWLKDWRLPKPKMHVSFEGDPAPDALEYEHHVRCEHKDLCLNHQLRRLIPVEACEVLTELFPDWQPLSSEARPCDICTVLIKSSKDGKLELRKKAENEKAKLKHLANGTVAVENSSESALVPNSFLKAWRLWLSRPTEGERPIKLDNSESFCEHNQLTFDPARRIDWELSHCLISSDEWKEFENCYTAGPSISVQKRPDGRLDHDVPVCEPCRGARKRDWETATIFVRIAGKPTKGSNGAPAEANTRKNGARQSKRLRQKEQGEPRQLIVQKATTVKEIKVMIDEVFNISAILQRLYHNGKELADNAATVSMLDILRDDILELHEDKEVLEISDGEDLPDQKKRKMEEEKGFGGTLLGGAIEQRSSSRENTENNGTQSNDQAASSSEKACTACTFANAADATTCAMCDSQL